MGCLITQILIIYENKGGGKALLSVSVVILVWVEMALPLNTPLLLCYNI